VARSTGQSENLALTREIHNLYIVFMNIREILSLDDGPAKTAALVAWIQGLSASDEDTPVLVGGAAVELYTGGAYTTGDIDLVGSMSRGVERSLREAGFERHGRYWIHEVGQVFVEFPGSALAPGEVAVWIEAEGQRVRVIAAEDLLVDRLGAWEYWRSSVDGVNAFLLWKAVEDRVDLARLQARVSDAGRTRAWRSLRDFAERWQAALPPAEEMESWANRGL